MSQYNYYHRELDRALNGTNETVHVKFRGDNGQSRWMAIPVSVAREIRELLGKLED